MLKENLYLKNYGLDKTSDFEHPTGSSELLELGRQLKCALEEEGIQEGQKRAYSVLSK